MRKVILVVVVLFLSLGIFAQTLQDAQKQMDNENYFKARQILFKLINDPSQDKAVVAYYLGNTLLNSDDVDSAKIFYKMVFNPDTRTALGYVATGRLALLAKDKVGAKAAFDRALQTSKSKNANIFFEIGDAYLRPEVIDVQQAISNLESAYNLDNKNTTIMLELGDAYLENSASDNTMGGKAMNKYEGASDLNPKLALAWIKIGRLDVRGRIYDDAIKAFKKALEIDHNYPIVYKELAETYARTRQFDQVKPNFEKYLELSPGDIAARTTLAALYFQSKEYQQAIDESNKGLKTDPNNYIFQRIISFSNYELKRYKDANDASLKFWDIANKKVKDIDYIYSARIAAAVGDSTRAMGYFKTALANDSANCDLIGEFGKVLYQARHYDEAIAQYAYKKAKCGSLSSIEVYYLGRSYVSMGDSIMSDTAFTEFIDRNPTSPDGYFNRARIRLKIGKLEDFNALPDYQKYIEVVMAIPDHSKYNKNLVEAYDYVGLYAMEKEKDKAKAKENFNKALELDPNDEIATAYLKQMK